MEQTNSGAKMCELQELLSTLKLGKIRNEQMADKVESLIADCWEEFTMDGDCGGMQPEKVWRRLEDLEWRRPVISFRIERHGAMFFGSSRAEMQTWGLNIQDGTKWFVSRGYRQVRPRQAKLDVRPIAKELSQAIFAGRNDPRLKWMDQDRDDVRILMGKILPAGLDPKETLRGRRKRLGMSLTALLAKEEWNNTTPNRYSKRNTARGVQLRLQ